MRISDWSSDVCSSDLHLVVALRLAAVAVGGVVEPVRRRVLEMHRLSGERPEPGPDEEQPRQQFRAIAGRAHDAPGLLAERSEERRVGKRVSVRVDLGGRRIIKKKTNTIKKI